MKSLLLSMLAVASGQDIMDSGVSPLMAKNMAIKNSMYDQYRAEGRMPLKGFQSHSGHVPCVGGKALEYECKGVDLYSVTTHFDLGSELGEGNDVWGWTDPETGDEIGIVGQADGTAFVRVEEDGSVTYLGRVPSTDNVAILWRDVKAYKNFAVIGSEAAGHGIQFFDMTQLRSVEKGKPQTFGPTALYTGVARSHNVVVNNETGYAYVTGSQDRTAMGYAGGLSFIDIRDPTDPKPAGGFAEDGYTHDAQCVIYRGPDQRYYEREICAAFNEDTLTIVDVTDKIAPKMLSRLEYEGHYYSHQGVFTKDFKNILLDDELDERALFEAGEVGGGRTKTFIFDVRDLEKPFYLGKYTSSEEAIDHNQYIRSIYAFQSNYTAGLRILDTTLVRWGRVREVGYFDTHPEPDRVAFLGTWSNYPYFESGYVLVNSIERGLFVVRPNVLKP